MKLNFYILIILNLFFYGKTHAQSPDWLWAKSIGGKGYDFNSCITTDALGNVYSTGYFNDTVDFDPGPGVFNLISSGGNQGFISKLDASGNFVWAKANNGSAANARSNGIALIVDSAGNIYVTGDFMGTVDFNPDSSVSDTLTSFGGTDIYISKYDNSGNFIWAKNVGGTYFEQVYNITLDNLNNVYTTGTYHGVADFDPGPGVFNLTTNIDKSFICKLDSSGNFIWAINGGGKNISVDPNGDIYSVGEFADTVDFDPDSTVNYFMISSSPIFYDIYITKLDSSRNFLWAKSMGSSGYDGAISLCLDPVQNIYVIGYFHDLVDFNPDPIDSFQLNSAGDMDIFISKFDNSGNFIWAKSMGGVDGDCGYDIVTDSSENLYTIGYFEGIADFNPDSSAVFNMNSNGGRDLFVSKLDSAGNFIWAKSAGGNSFDHGYCLYSDIAGNVFATGSFESNSVDFDAITIINTDTTGVYDDIYIARLDNLINGIQRSESASCVSIFPNPATNSFTISFPEKYKKISATINDLSGKLIYSILTTGLQSIVINTTDFSSGIFLVQIKSDEFIETKKLIIQK